MPIVNITCFTFYFFTYSSSSSIYRSKSDMNSRS
nr:MAG TPA: hypothetical protein [Caudoviricetes sp.]